MIRTFLFRAVLCVLIVLTLLAWAPHVLAGSISRGGGSFSSARSAPSPARSIGIQRSIPAATPAPAIRTNPVVPAPRPALAAPAAPVAAAGATATATAIGGGNGFLPTMAGSALGSFIGTSLATPHGGGTTVVNGGGMAAPGVAAAAPTVVSTAPASIWPNVLALLLCAGLAAGLYYVARRAGQRAAAGRLMPAAYAEHRRLPLLLPVSQFVRVQEAFARRDEFALRGLLGPNMLDQMLADLPDVAGRMTLSGVSAEVVDMDEGLGIATVRFRATDTSDGTTLDEYWHFDFDEASNTWRLDGIQQAK